MAEPKYNPKSKKWNAVVFSHKDPDGKRHYKSITANSKREWKRKEAEFIALRKGRSSEDMTVRECVEQYIKSREGVLSPSTIRGYRADQKQIAPLEDIFVSRIDSSDIQFFVSQLSRRLSPKSVRNIYSLLISSIGLVDERAFRVTLPAKIPVMYNTPTDADVQRLLDAAEPALKLCIALAACGTLRRGEICGLEYSDVLHDFSAVFVHRSVVKGADGKWYTKESPKTSGSVRRVILPEEVIKMIGIGEGRIYPHTPDYITHRFCRVRDSVGLKCRFHDLRHYAASVMHAIGVPDKYIMERGGWSDDRVLKAVYQNTLSDKVKEFTTLTNKYLSENIDLKSMQG